MKKIIYKSFENEIKLRMILAVVKAIYGNYVRSLEKKKFRTSTGFEPVISLFLCVALTN